MDRYDCTRVGYKSQATKHFCIDISSNDHPPPETMRATVLVETANIFRRFYLNNIYLKLSAARYMTRAMSTPHCNLPAPLTFPSSWLSYPRRRPRMFHILVPSTLARLPILHLPSALVPLAAPLPLLFTSGPTIAPPPTTLMQ